MAGPVSSQAKVGMEQWPAPDRMAAVRVGHLLANELVAKGAADSRVDWEGGFAWATCVIPCRMRPAMAWFRGPSSPSRQASKHLAGGGHAGLPSPMIARSGTNGPSSWLPCSRELR